MRRELVLGAATLSLVLPSLALAHGGSLHPERVVAGAGHVVSELDHLLAIVALALLAGQIGGRALVWAPAALAVGLVVGACSGAVVPPLAHVETMNLASIAVLGALVAWRLRMPPGTLAVAGLAFGWGHGYANVLDGGGQTPPPGFVLGVAVGAFVVVATVALATRSWRAGWQAVAVRAVGSWICAIGMMVLALELAG